jgi:hypothetical protein
MSYMQRWLLVPAIVAGCGNVQPSVPPDGASPDGASPDSAPPRDVLNGSLRNGCVLALHMDEASWAGATGEVKDDCGNDNPGTVVGQGTTTVAGGVSGRAGSFSGAACIDIPNAAALHATTGLTMSAWILPTKLNNGDGANGVISKRVANADQSEYNLSVWKANNVYVDLDGEGDRFFSNTVITERTWQQLTLVYDGTRPATQRARIYVNGSLDVTMPETSASLTPFTSTLHIGCMPAPTAMPPDLQHFIGEIDEVVIWNRALTDAEITQWYTNTKP